jgi:hypothetical protein
VGAAFAGCSGSSANYNVNDVASAVETVAKIENPLDITEDDLTYEFGVDMDKVEEFSGQKTGVANTAGTVLVVKASAVAAWKTSRLRWKITKTVLFP